MNDVVETVLLRAHDSTVAVSMPHEILEALRVSLEPFMSFSARGAPNEADWHLRVVRPSSLDEGTARPINVAEEAPLLAVVSPDQRTVHVGADGGSTLQLARYLRMLMRALQATKGEIFMHAAMVQFRGRGVMFVGSKRAGKTTALLGSLRAGADLVSNDDLSLALEPGAPVKGHGWPRRVSIRDDLFVKYLPAHVATVEADENGYRFFEPQRLAALMGTRCVPQAPLHLCVFPSFHDGLRRRHEVEELSLTEGVARLQLHADAEIVEKQNRVPIETPPGPTVLEPASFRNVRFIALKRRFDAVAGSEDWLEQLTEMETS